MSQLSKVCETLRRLLDKDVAWHWLPKHEAAMGEIKKLLMAVPVLQYYDAAKPVTILSDAAKRAWGAAFSRKGQSVAYTSCALSQAEQNYAQIEKECLSIVFACQRFHYYLREDITA